MKNTDMIYNIALMGEWKYYQLEKSLKNCLHLTAGLANTD
jgi:hypothetical protein